MLNDRLLRNFRRYVGANNPQGAYDARGGIPLQSFDAGGEFDSEGDDVGEMTAERKLKLLSFCRSRLSKDDLLELVALLTDYDDTAMDEPPPFPGRPRPGGRIDSVDRRAMDSVPSSLRFADMFPEAAKVGWA